MRRMRRVTHPIPRTGFAWKAANSPSRLPSSATGPPPGLPCLPGWKAHEHTSTPSHMHNTRGSMLVEHVWTASRLLVRPERANGGRSTTGALHNPTVETTMDVLRPSLVVVVTQGRRNSGTALERERERARVRRVSRARPERVNNERHDAAEHGAPQRGRPRDFPGARAPRAARCPAGVDARHPRAGRGRCPKRSPRAPR